MKITVRVRSVYGKRVVYPHCPAAKAFARIARTETLTLATLHEINTLGITIDVLPEVAGFTIEGARSIAQDAVDGVPA